MPSNPLNSIYQHTLNNPAFYAPTVAAVASAVAQVSLSSLISYFASSSKKELIGKALQKISESIATGNAALQKPKPDFINGISAFKKTLSIIDKFILDNQAEMTEEVTADLALKKLSISYAIAKSYFTIAEYDKASDIANAIVAKSQHCDSLNLLGLIQLREGLFKADIQAFIKAAATFFISLQMDATQNDIMAFHCFAKMKAREEKETPEVVIENCLLIAKYVESYHLQSDQHDTYISNWVVELMLVGALAYEYLQDYVFAKKLIVQSLNQTILLNSNILEVAQVKEWHSRIIEKCSATLDELTSESKTELQRILSENAKEVQSITNEVAILRKSKLVIPEPIKKEYKANELKAKVNKQRTLLAFLKYATPSLAFIGTAYYFKDRIMAAPQLLFTKPNENVVPAPPSQQKISHIYINLSPR